MQIKQHFTGYRNLTTSDIFDTNYRGTDCLELLNRLVKFIQALFPWGLIDQILNIIIGFYSRLQFTVVLSKEGKYNCDNIQPSLFNHMLRRAISWY
jgi:hypothetical protein